MARTPESYNDIVYVWRLSDATIVSTCVSIATFDNAEYVGEMTLRECKALQKRTKAKAKAPKAKRTKGKPDTDPKAAKPTTKRTVRKMSADEVRELIRNQK